MNGPKVPIGLADQSLSMKIYDEIRERIINGVYPPGMRLRERELAEEFDVSRIPLREALPQLEADGFIRALPRRGAVVTQLTIRDINELFDVRLSLEVFAASRAAERVANGIPPAPLHTAMRLAEEALDRGNPDEIAATNAALHAEIVALAGNALLTTLMRSVIGRVHWVFRLTSERDPAHACEEHRELCDAIGSGNPALASAVAYSHIERGRAPSIEVLRAFLPQDRLPENGHGRIA